MRCHRLFTRRAPGVNCGPPAPGGAAGFVGGGLPAAFCGGAPGGMVLAPAAVASIARTGSGWNGRRRIHGRLRCGRRRPERVRRRRTPQVLRHGRLRGRWLHGRRLSYWWLRRGRRLSRDAGRSWRSRGGGSLLLRWIGGRSLRRVGRSLSGVGRSLSGVGRSGRADVAG